MEKKSAEGAEDAAAPQARGSGGGGSFRFLWPKINLAKFRKFWDFLFRYIFFKNTFSIEKCLSVQVPFGLIGSVVEQRMGGPGRSVFWGAGRCFGARPPSPLRSLFKRAKFV